jgi:hypothetical protein
LLAHDAGYEGVEIAPRTGLDPENVDVHDGGYQIVKELSDASDVSFDVTCEFANQLVVASRAGF